jgi:hypothetical protein
LIGVRRYASFALLPGLCIALLLTPAPGAIRLLAAKQKDPEEYRLVPGPYDKKRPADEGAPTASLFTLKGLTVLVEPLDAEGRARFVEGLRPGMADPFAAAPGRPEQFLAFRVLFDNRSGSPVTFQPGNVLIVTNRKDHRYPLDVTDLYMQAERAGIDDPQRAANRVVPLIFDSSTTIRDGARLERLLVFRSLTMEEKWREFGLHFSFIQIDSDTHTLSFVYHKQPVGD